MFFKKGGLRPWWLIFRPKNGTWRLDGAGTEFWTTSTCDYGSEGKGSHIHWHVGQDLRRWWAVFWSYLRKFWVFFLIDAYVLRLQRGGGVKYGMMNRNVSTTPKIKRQRPKHEKSSRYIYIYIYNYNILKYTISIIYTYNTVCIYSA